MESDQITTILSTPPEYHSRLLKIWEDAIRATSDFLDEQHIQQRRALYHQHHFFDHVKLFHVEREGEIVGFIGIAYKKIEMLYVDPIFFDQGIGALLLQKAFSLKAYEIDVNEQNTRAVDFYLKHDFKIIARSELDSEGQPFPILHLKFKNMIVNTSMNQATETNIQSI